MNEPTCGRLDGKPDVVGDDGFVHGDELILSPEERARMPKLEAVKPGDESDYTYGTAHGMARALDRI